jgi:4-carboxymuconolactone decarboxylase
MTDKHRPADPAQVLAHEHYAEGLATRRAVLGDAHVERALAGADAFTVDFQDLITRYAWGEVWSRPGLDRRTRRCVTLAVLAALHCDDELALHVRAALEAGRDPGRGQQGGLSTDEIKEVLLQVAIYAGVPAANRAFAVARRVIGEEAG